MVSTSGGAFVAESALALSSFGPVELLVPKHRARHALDRIDEVLDSRLGLGVTRTPWVIPVAPAFLRTRDGQRRLFDRGAVDALEAHPRLWLDAVGASLGLARAVRRRGPHWRAALAHWLVPSGLACSLDRRLPLVVVAHSGDVHLLGRLGLTKIIIQMLARPALRLVVTSRFLQDKLLGSLPSRLRDWMEPRSMVQPMGFFARDTGPCPPGERAERAGGLGLDPKSRVVVFAGRLEWVKGPDIFVSMARVLAAGHPDTLFVLAGEGPMRRRVHSAAGGRVRLLGQLERRDLLRLLSLADVVVAPSRVLHNGRTESAPVILAEARAHGAALVAADVGGVGELVRHGVDGLLVSPGDIAGFVAAVDAVLSHDSFRRKIARAGQQRAMSLDWSVVAPRLAGGIDEAIEDGLREGWSR